MFHFANSFHLIQHNKNPYFWRKNTVLNADNGKLPSKFDRIIEDFIGKRYGAGEAFYGKRKSDMTDEELANTLPTKQQELSDLSTPMRDNAILIVGSIDTIGMWSAFELNEKGFNIRVACSDLKEAINIYGLPRNNVDLIELKGNQASDESYAAAVDGVQAIIICPNFSPYLDFGLGSKNARLETETALNM